MTSSGTKRFLLAVWVAVVGCLVGVGEARASGKVAVVVGGKADQGTRTLVQVSAAEAVRTQGLVYDKGGEGVQEAALLDCLSSDDRECTRKTVEPLAAEQVVVLAAEPKAARDGEETIVVTGWLLSEAGVTLSSSRRFCERCSTEALEQFSKELVIELITDARAREGRSVIRVRSQPAGAKVSIDGRAVGVTELEYTVYPGTHRVVVEHGGRAESREITVAPGEAVAVEVTIGGDLLEPGAGGARADLKPWLIGGGGALLLVSGIVLATVEGASSADGRLVYERTSYLVPGLVVSAVGLGAMGYSGWLLYREAKGEERRGMALARPRAGVQQVVLGPGGGGTWWLGVAGGF